MPRRVNKDTTWFKLDNAAKIYPVLKSSKDSFVFRIAVMIKETVKPDVLQQALLDLAPRFPHMFVRIKHGFFWYYLEANRQKPIVRPEPALVNQKIDTQANNHFFFSVFYYQNRISLETFHALCDGAGAIEFVKALVFRYFELRGHELENDGTVLTVDQYPRPEEMEDSFSKYVDKSGAKREAMIPAFHIKAKKFVYAESRGVITARLPADGLVALAKKHGATVTQYMVALLTYAIYETYVGQIPDKKPIRIAVPVNMRRYHPSVSLRNFSQYIHTTVYADKKLTFDDVLAKTKQDFETEIKPETFQGSINANVYAEKNIFVRLLPLFIKKTALTIIGKRLGSRLETATLSNVGIITLPPSLSPLVDRFEFNLATASRSVFGVGVGTYNGMTTISFLRSIYDTSVERRFFKTLATAGIEVTIESNFWEEKA
jgi:NRPS condensation-like uncharacterized protein